MVRVSFRVRGQLCLEFAWALPFAGPHESAILRDLARVVLPGTHMTWNWAAGRLAEDVDLQRRRYVQEPEFLDAGYFRSPE